MVITNVYTSRRPPQLRGFVCACHPAATGSNPMHTIYAFFNLYYWSCNEKRMKKQKRGRDWPIFKKEKENRKRLFQVAQTSFAKTRQTDRWHHLPTYLLAISCNKQGHEAPWQGIRLGGGGVPDLWGWGAVHMPHWMQNFSTSNWFTKALAILSPLYYRKLQL